MNRIYRHICLMLSLFIVFAAIGAPGRVHAKELPAMPVANRGELEKSVRAALGPDYRPVQLPITQQAKLVADDGEREEWFGYSVALSGDGNTALVGANYENTTGLVDHRGAAYIFVRNGLLTWTQQTKLLATDGGQSDFLGSSVALSADGNTALVGAIDGTNASSVSTGAVYVFTRIGTVWTQQAKLFATDGASGDSFGDSVALSADGNLALIGASGEDDGTTIDNNGAAYVFIRSGTVWTQEAKLLATDRDTNDNFGGSVGLASDGATAIIGASLESTPGTTFNGAAYIFQRAGAVWTQQTKLLSDAIVGFRTFGRSVAISGDGNTAISTDLGAAYVFTQTGSVWTQQIKLIASDAVSIGKAASLSFDGNTALIGAFDDRSGRGGGGYVYTRTGITWTERAILLSSGSSRPAQNLKIPIYESDNFGCSVALPADGSIGLLGAYGENSLGLIDSGAAYIFTDTVLPTATSTATSTMTSSIPTNTATATHTSTITTTPATATNTPIPGRPDTVGVYKNGVFYLRSSNSSSTSGVTVITALYGGDASDLPVTGDWNGDSVDTVGVYRGSTGTFFLSDSNTAPSTVYNFVFGNPDDLPFAGKWTADMTHDGTGVYRNSNGVLYQRKTFTTGIADFFAVFGNPGDKPVAGDWNGDGLDSIGIYRPSTQTWYLTNNSMPAGITFADISFVWDISVNPAIAGDWDGNGMTTIGYLYPAYGVFQLHTTLTPTGNLPVFPFGPVNARPIAGKWTVTGHPPIGGSILQSHAAGTINNSNSSSSD